MLNHLPPATLTRLAQLIVAFASPARGDRTRAMTSAGQLLLEHGLTWLDVAKLIAGADAAAGLRLASQPAEAEHADGGQLGDDPPYAARAQHLLACHGRFRPNERSFLRKLAGLRLPISDKQAAYLEGLEQSAGIPGGKA